MAGDTNTSAVLGSAEPFRYNPPTGPIQTSPHKLEKLANFDTRKHGDHVKDNVALDRPLLGASSMGHTILVDFETFETEILGLTPSLAAVASLPDKLVNHARLVFDAVFSRPNPPTEDAIAEQFIKVLNARSYGGLLNEHKAAFTGNHTSADGATSKVDAGLYLNAHVPSIGSSAGATSVAGKPDSEKPDWNHIRLFIEFKRKSTSLDPFDDYDPDAPEAYAQSRQAVRYQLTDYALVIRNCQHRTCIYGLFIIGPEFRLMRFDQSGIIVSKKKDYVKDPRPLLSFLSWFDKLSPEQQGYDPTATLVTEGSRAYKLMDEFAKSQPSDMPHAKNSRVPATYTPPNAAAGRAEPSRSPYNTRQKSKAAPVDPPYDEESYLDVVDLDDDDPRVFQYVREKFYQSLQGGWPRYRLEVGEEKRIFLVGKPIWTASWLFGRGTRGYVAFDVKKRRFVFLKDCWRPFYEGLKSEGAYLEILNSGGADAAVPTLIAHGDVAGQVTLTAQYANYRAAQAKQRRERALQQVRPSPSSTCSGTVGDSAPPAASGSKHPSTSASEDDSDAVYRHFTHYRIVVKDVCLPFTEIRSSKQLVLLLFDCVTTHSLAYTRHRLLHRDISAGNVIIRPSLSSQVGPDGLRKVIWKGILTDWELAKEVPEQNASDSEKPKEVPRQPERTGTWQFMSVAYVRNHPRWPVSVADELESFFHVLLFYAVRLLHHNITNVPSFVADYFDSYAVTGQIKRSCSAKKSTAMDDGVIRVTRQGALLQFNFPDGKPHSDLNDLITSLLESFKARYEVILWESQKSIPRLAPAVRSSPETSAIPGLSSSVDFDDERRPPSVDLAQLLGEQPAGQAAFEPSNETKRRAKLLDSHSLFIATLWNALNPHRHTPNRPPVWPKEGKDGEEDEEDVVPDRLPDTYDPRALISAMNKGFSASGVASSNATRDGPPPRKKMRTDASEPSGPSIPSQATRARTVGGSSGNSTRRGKSAKGKGTGGA
ncbi:hypothetical protein FKP32DRAFT_1601461 [Trametes sanguinea]|nr:hypothetical protein FKP32DRAFT_1601461 [Trametes sanguinea]